MTPIDALKEIFQQHKAQMIVGLAYGMNKENVIDSIKKVILATFPNEEQLAAGFAEKIFQTITQKDIQDAKALLELN